jgi:probable HAF family extracellular repeat protein
MVTRICKKRSEEKPMKRRLFAGLLALSFSGVVVAPSELLAAEEPAAQSAYYLVNLGTPFGGSSATAASINDHGWAAGGAVEADANEHATLWLGTALDLGTLGGPNSNIAWPDTNKHGALSGIAETAMPDPNKENWSCSGFFPTITHNQCLGFVWQWGVMNSLPTLGGTNGYAAGNNSWGEIAGWAETSKHDSTCVSPQVLQFEAVVWGPIPSEIRQLPPYPGDPDSAATAINDQHQVVGISGTCDNAIGEFSARHALLWQNGRPINLGSFGGVAWNTPTALNNQGQIVGFADLPGDQAGNLNPVGFLWTQEHGIQKLRPYPGDKNSLAWGINERGQAVGQSIDANGNSRAVIWQNGEPLDLNALIPAGSSVYLTLANEINDHGEISGQGCVVASGSCSAVAPALLLIPTQDNGAPVATETDSPAVVMSDAVRRAALQRVGVDHLGAGR